jgi:DNA-binding response OmpR family regulator
MRLLLIEDEEMLGRTTADALVQNKFTVDWVKCGHDAIGATRTHEYDAILLDLGLSDIAGDTVLKDVRARRSETPVIVLTARGQVEDRVTMLDLGADDYMVKPFNISELCARLRAVKRRVSAGAHNADIQTIGPLEFQQASRSVRWNGRLVTLTAKEFDLLEILVIRRPRVVSRAQLEQALYGWGDEVESNAIEVYIHFLRRKLSPKLIVTERGRGYRIGIEAGRHADAGRADTLRP